jgi:hypothetical protein
MGRSLAPVTFLSLACLAGGCTENSDPSTMVDESALLARVQNEAYSGSLVFQRVNLVAWKSGLAPNPNIDTYVDRDGASEYTQIAPEKDGSGADVPVGTMIVRQVLDQDGAVAKITLMAKGPPGYNADCNDFWFGVTDPLGQPLITDGRRMTGHLEQCYSCHQTRPHDGFLFGVPMTNRM